MQEWLTDSELLLMKMIWKSKDPLTVQEVMALTNTRYDKNGRCRLSPRF